MLATLLIGAALLGLAAWRFAVVRRGLGVVLVLFRRLWWISRLRLAWKGICRDAKLADSRQIRRGEKTEEVWRYPKLRHVRTSRTALRFKIRARRGQTLDELEAAAERIASALDVKTWRAWPDLRHPKRVLVLELHMRELLRRVRTATLPAEPRVMCDRVRLGITQAGSDWMLKMKGFHTLVVGASGSGKGSILWNIALSLAPAVKAEHVALWGIDLKGGIELAMGRPLFYRSAYTVTEALALLERLADVAERRSKAMAGVVRDFTPTMGDPMHVLVIDELASLTAYGDRQQMREAEKLLGKILTLGRAMGVIVVAFIQDPRKEVINVKGLFTQRVALRLLTADETNGVLDGQAAQAPAHRIDPSMPGVAWIVEDNGAVDRARADYVPDELIREAARLWPNQFQGEIEPEMQEGNSDTPLALSRATGAQAAA